MKNMAKILVTGAAGYIGSVLVRQLIQKGYDVLAYDNLLFGGESLLGVYNHPRFSFIKGDIRDKSLLARAVGQVEAVVHLAAIVGDPACAKQADLAREINWGATKALFDISCKAENLRRFIFASTCSNYGKMEGSGYVNEESPLRPVSLYAELKVRFEEYLLGSAPSNSMVPVALRFATVYGLSPRMRFDLTVNEFIREVSLGRELLIFGEQFWRPYCHVNDLAGSCVLVLESDEELVDRQVYGVGDTSENYQKKSIAEEILRIVPGANIKYVAKSEDPRDYRVDFAKIKQKLGFSVTKTVPEGLREIHSLLADGLLLNPDSPAYRNT